MNAGGVLNTCKSNEAFRTDYFGMKFFMTEWRTGE
jgi:hypothetical protein